jgi:adenosine deaminase
MEKEIELFKRFINTLFHSWGSDSPPEAYWAGNEFLNLYAYNHNITITKFFNEEDEGSIEEVMDEVSDLLTAKK